MAEALAGLVRHSFRSLDLGRIEAACLPENTPSRRTLERTGFVHEGEARRYLQIDGRWRDHVLYAVLRPEREMGE